MPMSPEDLLMHLPHDMKGAASRTLPAIESSYQDEIEVDVVVRIKFVRRKYTAGRAKGRQTWEADSAAIVSADGKEPIFPDWRDTCTSAWLK